MNLIEELIHIEEKENIPPEESLYHKFLTIQNHFQHREIMIQILFPLYTLHNHIHSDTIINILTSFDHKKLLGKNPLNKYEIFLLIAAAYFHDIGMMIIKEEDKGDKINTDNIRENHHIRSFEYILEKKRELDLDDFEAFNLALICKGHRKENLYDNPDYDPVPYPKDPNIRIRIDLLTALLRIADELDISCTRVEFKMREFLQEYQTFHTITNLHWYKHYFTINYTPAFIETPLDLIKLSIVILFRLPDKMYEKSFIIPFVMHPIQKEINYLQQIFNHYGFSIELHKPPKIRINNILNKIPKKLYDDFYNYLLIKKDIKVLIVDDENSARLHLSYIIEDLNYQVEMAVDSKTALEKIKSNTYHLILLDLEMPDLKHRKSKEAGLELLKEIKNMRKQHIVVMVSAMNQSQLIIESLKKGAYDYILKKMPIEEIKDKIEEALKMNFHILNENI